MDDSFPPAPTSLFLDPSKPLFPQPVCWQRPGKIASYNGRQRLSWAVYRTPMPDDITQGILGNCWLVQKLCTPFHYLASVLQSEEGGGGEGMWDPFIFVVVVVVLFHHLYQCLLFPAPHPSAVLPPSLPGASSSSSIL